MKDAYWFKHDANAKDDPKCLVLIEEMGAEGYGIYWMLIESLRSETDYRLPLAVTKALSRRFNTSDEKVLTVISRYGLFQRDDEWFWSDSLLRRMNAYDEVKEKRRLAGRRGGEAKAANAKQEPSNVVANAKQMPSKSLANRVEKNRIEKSRVEKSKEMSDTDLARVQWNKDKSEPVRIYLEVFKRPLRSFPRDKIAQYVTDKMPIWRDACEYWDEQGYNPNNVDDLLKRYRDSLKLDQRVEADKPLSPRLQSVVEYYKKEGASADTLNKLRNGQLIAKRNPQGFYQLMTPNK